MAFSNLKASYANREYRTFADFVRECALIWHNAHVYNTPEAGAYVDASTIKGLMEQEFRKLVEHKVVPAETVAWPDLGEIPSEEERPEGEEAEEEEDDEDEDEEDEDEEDEEGAPKKKRGGRPRNSMRKSGANGAEGIGQKKRGRPPKIATPMEARMKNILKALRKPKNSSDELLIRHFEKLPDKAAMPEYFVEIKRPMSFEQIKVRGPFVHIVSVL